MLSACATAPPAPVAVSAAPAAPVVTEPMQYLYGSGEAAALTAQTWRALVAHVAAQVKARPADSVALAADATLAAPRYVPCAGKPFAAVFDVDETMLLNVGFAYDETANPGTYNEARWEAWERTGAAKVSPTPGAVEGIAALRALGVTVVYNTNRLAANAAQTSAAIDGAGLGPAVHGDTLFLKGDDATGGRKDARRAAIAARYCVLALAGDQLGDISDLFNAGLAPAPRRATTMSPALAGKWGVGWFVFPNPTYGTALKGGFDDVFPIDKRWVPPAQEK